MTEFGNRVYEDPDGRFVCEVPHDWLVDTNTQGNVAVAFICPEEERGFRANVNVVVDHVPPLSVDEYIALCRLQLKRACGKPVLPVDEPNLDRSNLHIFEWINRLSPIELQVLQNLHFSRSKAFTVTATAPATTFRDYRDSFETTFASFRIMNPSQL